MQKGASRHTMGELVTARLAPVTLSAICKTKFFVSNLFDGLQYTALVLSLYINFINFAKYHN